MKTEHKSASSKKKKLGLKITVAVIFLLISGAVAYAFSVYSNVTDTVKQTHEPLKRSKEEQRVIHLSEGDPASFLLLGVDQREGDRGRPDSLILLTANPGDKSLKILSIPRDIYTEIIGKGLKDKINHSYTYGGVDITIKTIEKFLDVPIDYYVEVDMNGFKDLIDAVGGVTVNNTLDFSYKGMDFPVGQLNLSGEEALQYSRMRSLDPKGDFGRQERQRKIIQASIKEAVQFDTLTNYENILEVIGENVKTNLTFEDMINIQKNYAKTRNNIEHIQIDGSGEEVEGVYYYMVPEEERIRQSDVLREQLAIK